MSNSTANPSFDPENCTYATCSVKEYGQLQYIPTLAGNAIFCAIFAIALLGQLYYGIRKRTWGYLVAMLGGCALEIIGYIARIMLNDNVFDNNYFIIYLVGLTIGPAFFSAAIYLCLARIIAIYGESLPILKARTITLAFILCDLASLILQSAGGAITSMADTQKDHDLGVNIMIAGLVSQVASTTAFLLVCAHLAWAIRTKPSQINPNSLNLRSTKSFRFFLWGKLSASCML